MADPNDRLIQAIESLTTVATELPSTLAEQFDSIAKTIKPVQSKVHSVIQVMADKIGLDASGLATVLGLTGKTVATALKLSAEGIQQSSKLSITAQEGVGVEFRNQLESIKSHFTLDPNQIFNKQQLYAAETGLVTALAGISDGLQIDPAKIGDMISEMRTGLRSQIIPTADTFKTLAVLGIKPTTNAMNELREATGRAAIGQGQMDVLNKNRFALQVFGIQIAKTTLDLERAGISLTSAMAGAESYVTNLDSAVDAIAQLNQLGTSIDFGQFSMLQEFDPAGAIKYMADKISPDQLQSSSFRALLKSIPGLDVSALLAAKGLNQYGRAIEAETTKSGTVAGIASKAMAWLTHTWVAGTTTFISLIATAFTTIASYRLLTTSIDIASAKLRAMTPDVATSAATPLANAARPAPVTDKFAGIKGGAGLGTLVGAGIGITSGISTYNETGSLKKSIISAIGPLLGSLLGGIIGGALAPFTLGASLILTPILIGLGAMLGKSITDKMVSSMNDGISTPEAGRTLTTSAGSFSLNPDDTVVAGTNLAGKPSSEQPQAVDMIPLMRKIDDLIGVIKSANTTIQVPGMPQTVNRMQLVGVFTRDETVRSI